MTSSIIFEPVTLNLDRIFKNFNIGCYLVMVATWQALLSSDNSYYNSVFPLQVFPLDYIMFAGIVLYLVLCSMSGIRNMGIWFFCLRVRRVFSAAMCVSYLSYFMRWDKNSTDFQHKLQAWWFPIDNETICLSLMSRFVIHTSVPARKWKGQGAR